MLSIKRETKQEAIYGKKMGCLITPVIRIKLCIFGFPFQTLHEYRETYYGEIKDCKNCKLNK
jgi:hypothetical protein